MAETRSEGGPDPEAATALEIGMSFLKAQRAMSEGIAEAERLARELIMRSDRRAGAAAADQLAAGYGVGPAELPGTQGRPPEEQPVILDLRSLASQVDEIERNLLSNHERIVRLFDSAALSGADARAQRVVETAAPPAYRPEPVPEGDATDAGQASALTLLLPDSGRARAAVNGTRTAARRDPEPQPSRPQAPWSTILNPGPPAGTAEPDLDTPPVHRPTVDLPGPTGWAPPDPSSRVDLPVVDRAGEEAEPLMAPPMAPSSYADPTVSQHAAARRAYPAEETVRAHARRSTRPSTSLWLLNVVGFSVLLIVVVIALMLANVL